MFGSQNAKTPTETKAAPAFDPKTIPVHTMQDDLDMLSGKVKAVVPAASEEKSNPFAVENKKMEEKATPRASAGNPFAQTAPSPEPLAAFSPTPVLPPKPVLASKPPIVADVPVAVQKIQPEPASSGAWVGILVGILVLLGALGGGYYFYMTRYNTPAADLEAVPADNIPENVPEVVPEVVVTEKFSADKPNYLLVDVEEMTAADIQQLLLQKGGEIEADGKTVPIEFVVTDVNNNPIALKIFALLMKISFPAKLLDNFQDDFSLFVFHDEGVVRLGLGISPKDATKILADMKTEEKGLVKNLEPLFLGEIVKSQTPTFQDAKYGDAAIRYMNLNDRQNLSIDYFMVQNQLVIATSKSTAWAIIDKLAGAKQ